MDTPNNNKDVLGSDTEATSSVVESTPPEFIDLTEEELEDQMIAVDDYNAIYTRSLAIREMFPSLNDDTCWTGKWQLKPKILPNLGESVAMSRIELYTDEEIDWDNWNAAVNLAIAKISKAYNYFKEIMDRFSENKTPKRRPECVPGKKRNGYECTRCHAPIDMNMIDGLPHPQICFPKRHKRFHPYIK